MSDAIPADLRRYHRQMLLPGFGVEGQRRLAASHAVVVGCGALGTVAAEALARAGVGTLTIIDRDIVESTNLQRQTLFTEADAERGTPKAAAAAERLGAVNSSIRIRGLVADVNPRSVEHLVAEADVVLDGTDNFETRYLLNDACIKHGLPLAYGGVVGTTGLTMTIVPAGAAGGAAGVGGGATPCLRCVFPEPPPPGASPTCDTAGVLGPMAGVVASIQAAEALKVLLGRFDLLRPVVSQFDIWGNQRRTIDLRSVDRSGCPCCAHGRYEFLARAAEGTTTICGAESVQVLPGAGGVNGAGSGGVDLIVLQRRLAAHGEFEVGPYILRGRFASDGGSTAGLGLTVFRDGRAIVKGTTDAARARSVYARFVGG